MSTAGALRIYSRKTIQPSTFNFWTAIFAVILRGNSDEAQYGFHGGSEAVSSFSKNSSKFGNAGDPLVGRCRRQSMVAQRGSFAGLQGFFVIACLCNLFLEIYLCFSSPSCICHSNQEARLLIIDHFEKKCISIFRLLVFVIQTRRRWVASIFPVLPPLSPLSQPRWKLQ